MKLEFSRQILEQISQILNFMKLHPVVTMVLHTDRQDKVNIHFLQFCVHTKIDVSTQRQAV
jgi:hypothetical protein